MSSIVVPPRPIWKPAPESTKGIGPKAPSPSSPAGASAPGSMNGASVIVGVVVAAATPVIISRARRLAKTMADRRRKSEKSSMVGITEGYEVEPGLSEAAVD